MYGTTAPIYAFTYAIELPNFAFADRQIANTDVIDHSIAARTHAQFVAIEIWEEGHQSTAAFIDPTQRLSYLIEN